MNRIRITEKKFGRDERVIFDERFEKMMLVTDEDFGMVGVRGFNEVMLCVDSLLDNVAIMLADLDEVPEEERTTKMVEDVALVKTLVAFNTAMMTLGPIADTALRDDADEETRERYKEMLAIAEAVKDLSFRVADLSDSFSVSDWKRNETEAAPETTS